MLPFNERRIGTDPADPRGSFSLAPEEITGQNAVALMKIPFSDKNPVFAFISGIEQQAERIRQEVTPHILRGIELFVRRVGLGHADFETDDQRQEWLWAAKSSKYNAVYLVSRREAKENIDFVRKSAANIDEIGRLIDGNGGVARIANYALHSYAQEFTQTPGRKIKTSIKSIPRHAIQGYDQNTLIVRSEDFLSTDPRASFETPQEIHDWHDLVHMVIASSSSGAFGVKYNDGLNNLPRYYRALTEGEGMQDASGPAFSDGMLFSQLSRPVFEYYESQKLPDGINRYSYDEIQRLVAQELFLYLGGGYGLLHPGTGRELKVGRTIDPLELAVCEQNKRYERRAAEIEREVFVRGTPEGKRGNPLKDPLSSLTRSQRIELIANLGDDPLYFEARNLTRHRAHEDALGQFAGYLLGYKRSELARVSSEVDRIRTLEDIRLLEATVDFYQMNDLRQGAEINLYRLVGDIIKARRARGVS